MRHQSANGSAIRLADVFSLSPVVIAIIVGILLGIVEFGLFVRMWFVVFVLAYALWITANYFLEIVEYKALGNAEWPVFSLDTLVAGRNQLGIVFSLLVLVAAGIYGMLRYLGMDDASRILLVAGLVALPASVALLAVTRELSTALNPIKALHAVARIGYAYVLCLIGAVAIFALFAVAESRGGIWYFPVVYGLFLFAYLIGAVVYARRMALGLHVPKSPEVLAERARAETVAIRKGILSHAYGFAAHGNRAGALKHIEDYLASDESTLEARLWFFDESLRWEDPGVAFEFGRRLIEYCERRGFADEVASVRAKCELLSAHVNR